MPELRPLAEAFNLALTGDDPSGDLASSCNQLIAQELEPSIVIRITTFLAETFTDEVGPSSGAVTKSLVSTLGQVCGLLADSMVSDMSRLARRDALTGLENRLAWNDALAQAGSTPMTLAIIDLDGLKQINDELGHDEGDRHLQKFAADLVSAVPDGAVAYRLGGDEYALSWANGEPESLKVALQHLEAIDGVAAFSFGIAASSQEMSDLEMVAKLADDGMYVMKATHKSGQ